MKISYLIVIILTLLCNIIIPQNTHAQGILQIPRTDKAPLIDGVADAVWMIDTEKPLGKILAGEPTTPTDFSAYFKSLWDASGLYILAVVTDDVRIKDSGTALYQDDAVEIYIDIDNNKLPSYGTNDYQYTFRWNDPVAYSKNGTISGVSFSIKATTTGYILEAKFPWNTLGLPAPQQGVFLGFDLHVQDDDNGGERDNKLAWFTAIDNSWQDPSLFATAKLVDELVIVYAAEKPKISAQEGFYQRPFEAVISTGVDKMKIYYTLDGSDPALSPYAVIAESPVKVKIDPLSTKGRGKTPGVVLRARAKSDQQEFSPAATRTYLFNNRIDNQTRYPGFPWPQDYAINDQQIDLLIDATILNDSRYTNLMDDALMEVPTISITTDYENLFDPDSGIYVNALNARGAEWERPASVELINPDGSKGFQIDAGLRIRGGWSRNGWFRKHAFRLFFRSEYGEGKLNFPLFEDEGVKSFDKVDLRCAQNYSWSKDDGDESPLYTFTRDVFSRDTQGKMDQEYTRSRYYHLYINGLYWGLYQTQERPEANFAADYMGGSSDDYDVVKRSGGDYGIEATDGSLDAWMQVWKLCQEGFSSDVNYNKIQGLNENGVRDTRIPVLVDIDNLIDYMNLIFYTGNYDAPVSAFGQNKRPNNFYAIYNKNDDRGFVFVAHDNEHTLIVDPINSSSGITENRVNIGNLTNSMKMVVTDSMLFHPQWLHFKLCENAEYRNRFSDRSYKQYFNKGVFTPDVAAELFRKRTLEIDTAVIAESARWAEFHGNLFPTKDDFWIPAVEGILNGFFPFRTDIVIGQLQDEGLLSTIKGAVFKKEGVEIIDEFIQCAPGEALVIANPSVSGNVTYTIDGSDPRMNANGISSTAINGGKTATLSILQSCVVKARVFNNGEWSPLRTLSIKTGNQPTALQLTEIHYNPLSYNGISGSEYEFIELKNMGTTPIDLRGAAFIDGIQFTFSNEVRIDPGEFFVLASSAFLFNQLYGKNPSGEFEGQLDNKGERIILIDAIGDTLISVNYNDKAPWPTTPDSIGFSLVPLVRGLSADWNNGLNWRASSKTGGSPFADDDEVELVGIIINEILSNSEAPQVDAIELFNPTNSAVNLSGWYLSDSRKFPKKWKIPAGTIIPANGYIVFNEGHYAGDSLQYSSNEFGSSFSISSHGDEIYLFSGTEAGELSGYEYGFDFNAIETGVSFGRYVTSVGKTHFVAQQSTSLNAMNELPRVGPVLINQIMYNPAANQFEFLELVNTSNEAVNLFDETNGIPWKVSGIDFVFPRNCSLVPNQKVYLIESQVTPSDFRALFAIDSESLVFNYNGSLKNEGEEITLFKSHQSYFEGDSLIVPYIRIDKVDYNDNSNWPDADGNGYALQRISNTAYGNDPASWIAVAPGLRIKNSYLAEAIEGVGYSHELTALGGSAPYTWSSSGNGLPEGLTLNPITGIIEGMPIETGTFNIHFTVEDAAAATAASELTLIVNANTQPQALNDTLYIMKNHIGSVNVIGNDIDNDGDKASWAVEIVSPPQYGTCAVNFDRTLSITPDRDFMGSDSLTYRITDITGSTEAKVIIFYYDDAVLYGNYKRVDVSSDDAEENIISKEVNIRGRTLEMGEDKNANANQLVGLRFKDLYVPEGAIIKYANLYFNSAAIETAPASFTIYGQAAINPATFSTDNLISSRPKTTASVVWNPEPWNNIGEGLYDRVSPDLMPIMDELMSMGWNNPSPIAFIISGEGTRSAKSFNSEWYSAPVLQVFYTLPDIEITTPVAIISSVAKAGKGEFVALDGSKSYSDDYRRLNHYWSIVSKPEGSTAQLSNPNSPIPEFEADQFGDYVVTLSVDNGYKASNIVSITITISNQPPVAIAGSNQTQTAGSAVRLIGSGSSDANGDYLTYKWEWIEKPAGSTAQLSSATEANPVFTADQEGKYILSLTVSDYYSSSVSDNVEVTVIANRPPTANAGNNSETTAGLLVALNGTASSDPEGDKLTYNWVLVSKPAGSLITFQQSTLPKPVIQPDIAGDYIINLTVSDGMNVSAASEVKVTAINNLPPVALAGSDRETTEYLTVNLDGSESFDPENKPLIYQWSFISKPFGSNASLLNAHTVTPSFIADTEGLYALKLRISDGTFTAEDQIQIIALNDVAITTLSESNGLKVYPNPFGNRLVVEYFSETKQQVELSLFNLSGVKINSAVFESNGKNTRVLNLENQRMTPGVYLLLMKPERGTPRMVKVIHNH